MMERTAARSAAIAMELRNVVRQTEELVRALGEDRDEIVTGIRNRVTGALAAAKARLAEMDEQARWSNRSVRIAADLYARENPWTVVALGAALGLILGASLIPRADPPTG